MKEKLYVAVRDDLDPGSFVAQAVHAAVEISHLPSESFIRWKKKSNTVVVMSIPKESIEEVSFLYPEGKIFSEPDMGNQKTSIAFISPKFPKIKMAKLAFSI